MIYIISMKSNKGGFNMNLKRIALRLNKLDTRSKAIELEKLHNILTINQWNKVYQYLMSMNS